MMEKYLYQISKLKLIIEEFPYWRNSKGLFLMNLIKILTQFLFLSTNNGYQNKWSEGGK